MLFLPWKILGGRKPYCNMFSFKKKKEFTRIIFFLVAFLEMVDCWIRWSALSTTSQRKVETSIKVYLCFCSRWDGLLLNVWCHHTSNKSVPFLRGTNAEKIELIFRFVWKYEKTEIINERGKAWALETWNLCFFSKKGKINKKRTILEIRRFWEISFLLQVCLQN